MDHSQLHLVVKTWLGPFLNHQFKQASKAQIAAIEEMEGKNNRPTQPLNQRDVEVEQ